MLCQITSDAGANNSRDFFEGSLLGEYSRILLLGTAACSTLFWGLRLPLTPLGLAMLAGNLVLFGTALGVFFQGLFHLRIPSLLAAGAILLFAVQEEPAIWWSPFVVFSPAVTICVLLGLVACEGIFAVGNGDKSISPWKLVFWVVVLGASIYMIVIPSIDALIEPWRERPTSFRIEQLSPWELLRVRSSKLVVFSTFAYAGACLGSFLNVVAASAPRGESIALRSSACPVCNSLIRRTDNLPIFSYARLRGRCRDCGAMIPKRYFMVELTGFVIFAALFLYELVTGAANVPGFRHYSHTGILWMILYTKWPVVGIYFFHCLLFSCVLMLGLMEQDKLRPPRWMILGLPLICSGIAIFSPSILTISFGDQTPLQLPAAVPDWLDRAITSGVGGLLGWIIGFLTKSIQLRRGQSSGSLQLAFVLLGVSLGWQTVLSLGLFWLLTAKAIGLSRQPRLRPRWLTSTTLLFAIAMVFHPFWKCFANHLSL